LIGRLLQGKGGCETISQLGILIMREKVLQGPCRLEGKEGGGKGSHAGMTSMEVFLMEGTSHSGEGMKGKKRNGEIRNIVRKGGGKKEITVTNKKGKQAPLETERKKRKGGD